MVVKIIVCVGIGNFRKWEYFHIPIDSHAKQNATFANANNNAKAEMDVY